MDIFLLILLAVIGFVAGIIPLGGAVYGIGLVALGDFFGWEASEMLIIMIAVLLGSIVGTILGYALEVGTLGFIWFWSRGSFSNLTASLAVVATLVFDIITGMLTFAAVLTIGVVIMRKDGKHLPKKCVTLGGKEFCIGSDE
jgi:hypothetical protein